MSLIVKPGELFAARACLLSLLVLLASGCTINITRYTDGPLTQYLQQPIPPPSRPIARTVSLEKVIYQTAANLKATMISDLVAQEIYIMPEDVGAKVRSVMNLDQAYSKDSTYQALNIIAENRTKARHMWAGASKQTAPTVNVSGHSTSAYIKRQESMATEAYKKGDYLAGNIHSTAAASSIQSKASVERTLATADLLFSSLNALAAAGEAMIKDEFIRLRRWIESESGAIGGAAPEGTHLSVFFLQFFDAESFQLDSRIRVAVYMVLTDRDGKSISVLKGSDILNCEGECNLFQPKSTAKLLVITQNSADVQQKLWTADGRQNLDARGFDALSGVYQYLLIKHGLRELGEMAR